MRCPTCQHDNLDIALFCAQCGARLRDSPPEAPALLEKPQPRGATSGVRISLISASLSLFLAGLVASSLLGFLLNWGFYGVETLGVETLLIILAAPLGALAGLAVTGRLHRVGRLQSVVGMVLMGVGLATQSVGYGDHFWAWNAFGMALAGLGIGVAHPLPFWRNLGQVSGRGKLLLAIAAVAGILAFAGLASFGGAVALVIGVPLVLSSPIVRGPADRARG